MRFHRMKNQLKNLKAMTLMRIWKSAINIDIELGFWGFEGLGFGWVLEAVVVWGAVFG